MNNMFCNAYKFNKDYISRWDTSCVRQIQGRMFNYANNFNKDYIINWDTSKVIYK